MLLPLDVYRFHSLDTPVTILATIAILKYLYNRKNSIAFFISLALLLSYSIFSLINFWETVVYVSQLTERESQVVDILTNTFHISGKELICTNYPQAPWVLLDNPVSIIPTDYKRFLDWKDCEIICIYKDNTWLVWKEKKRK